MRKKELYYYFRKTIPICTCTQHFLVLCSCQTWHPFSFPHSNEVGWEKDPLSAKIRCLNYKMMKTEGGGCCFGSPLQTEQETKISHRAKKTGQQPQSLTTQVPVHLFQTTVHLLLSSLKACWYFCITTINVPIFIFPGLECFSVPSNKVR